MALLSLLLAVASSVPLFATGLGGGGLAVRKATRSLRTRRRRGAVVDDIADAEDLIAESDANLLASLLHMNGFEAPRFDKKCGADFAHAGCDFTSATPCCEGGVCVASAQCVSGHDHSQHMCNAAAWDTPAAQGRACEHCATPWQCTRRDRTASTVRVAEDAASLKALSGEALRETRTLLRFRGQVLRHAIDANPDDADETKRLRLLVEQTTAKMELLFDPTKSATELASSAAEDIEWLKRLGGDPKKLGAVLNKLAEEAATAVPKTESGTTGLWSVARDGVQEAATAVPKTESDTTGLRVDRKLETFVGAHDFTLRGANAYAEEVTVAVAARGFVNNDDAMSARLIGFTAKLQRGEAVKAVVLGGSASVVLSGVQQGPEPGGALFADRLREWLNEAYPQPGGGEGAAHAVVNLAEPGHGSIAFAQKMLALRPQWGDADVVIVEFGINDGDDGRVDSWVLKQTEAAYEAVLRTLLHHSDTIAVIVLELASVKYTEPSLGEREAGACAAASEALPHPNSVLPYTHASWSYEVHEASNAITHSGESGRVCPLQRGDGAAARDTTPRWRRPRTAEWVHRPISRMYGVPVIDFTKAFEIDQMMRTIEEALERAQRGERIEELPFGCRQSLPWRHYGEWATSTEWPTEVAARCNSCRSVGCFARPPSKVEACDDEACTFAPERAPFCTCLAVFYPQLHLRDGEHHHGGILMHAAVLNLLLRRMQSANRVRERLSQSGGSLPLAFPIPSGYLHNNDEEYTRAVEALLPDRTALYASASVPTAAAQDGDGGAAWQRADNLVCLHYRDCPSFAPRERRQCATAYWEKVDQMLPAYDGTFDDALEPYDADRGGWQFRAYKRQKRGWIYDETQAGAPFALRLSFDGAETKTFSIGLGMLKSYENMGVFTCLVTLCDGSESTIEVDGQWAQRTSVFDLVALPLPTPLRGGAAGGEALLVITPHAMIADGARAGNKVKLLSVSVRQL